MQSKTPRLKLELYQQQQVKVGVIKRNKMYCRYSMHMWKYAGKVT